ncbi:hypothetical protein FHS29_007026 [Saccharothrix tamanrassetensis]|uniref:Ricin B lectin domain-containing protein n=1 Tax=Saccharothrix tamanrassetensis TaxID=1051531 RepID=A0A841CPP8_9PSEU|nr:ricin-type beta-trefoil lectin domain protein [Saccharothrix tamanrassetensis]MBB5960402.1 hypothetical protein [Saccharothrix tamanrassetensis]
MGLILMAGPASAAESPRATGTVADAKAGDANTQATWFLLRNRKLSGKCIANHHPKVFVYRCEPDYADQLWTLSGVGQLANGKSGACLAMHANGRVFTHRCDTYQDQRWIFRDVGDGFLIENAEHRGKCIAAHSDGKVFGFRCTTGYQDQHWY